MINYIHDAQTEEISLIAAPVGNLRPKWRDKDGALWATYSSTLIQKSTDEGKTWATVLTITGGDLAGCGLIVSNTGRIIVGEYATKSVIVSDEAQTTYSTAFTFGDQSYFGQQMAQCAYDNVIILGGYDGDAIGENARKEVWMSQDYGATWAKIFEATVINSAHHCHIHDVEYDHWDARIYVSIGDRDNKNIYYSDDMGSTWVAIFPDATHAKNQQPSQIVSFSHGIIFGSDSAFEGLHYWAKPGYRSVINPNDIQLDYYALETTGNLKSFATRKWVVRSNDFNLVVMPFCETFPGGKARLLATKDGITWYEIFKHITTDDAGFKNIIAPVSSDTGEGLMAIFMEGSTTLNIFTRSNPIFVRD